MMADVCLLLEGSYPYVAGGVSSWTHDLIRAQSDLTFHVVSLMPTRATPPRKYELPPNVVGHTHIALQELAPGSAPRGFERLVHRIGPSLEALQDDGHIDHLGCLLREVAPHRRALGRTVLLDSRAAFALVSSMYGRMMPDASFINYFWSWRSLAGGLFAVALAELPDARVYHSVSTGFAGLLAARAKLETGRPVILTEHGIYTNERRIEITMADWLGDRADESFSLDRARSGLRELWIRTFESYSRICYEACDQIITLYSGNQVLQRRDGAPEHALRVVPNGVDLSRFASVVAPDGARPRRIGFVGRVVPIKDVKTFIRACALVMRRCTDVEAVVLGPVDEDDGYARECRALVASLGMEDRLRFLGQVRLEQHLATLDVVVLTSISEAQPLVVLEAGAVAIPVVATDVGSCRELLEGRPDETPALGPGGIVTSLASPEQTSAAIVQLLQNENLRIAYGRTLQERVRRYYNKAVIDQTYRAIYREQIEQQATWQA